MPKERRTLSDAVMKRFVEDPNSAGVEQSTSTVSLGAIKISQTQQPRRYFDPDKMAQLVTSVRKHGILEPLLVRPIPGNKYELIAGERRLRAAREVGLKQVPIISKHFSDQEALQVSLVENLQRDDLNPIEETEAVLQLLAITLNISVEDVKTVIYQAANAKVRGQELKGNVSLQLETIENMLSEIGRFNLESFRSSRLPLLNLPEDVLDVLRQGKLEYTKARAIARIKDEEQRSELLQKSVEDGLSLNMIKQKIKEVKQSNTPKSDRSASDKALLNRLTDLTKRLKVSKAWAEKAKRDRIKHLLDELESVVGEA